MSAFTVDKPHIDAIVSAAARYVPAELADQAATNLGRMLWAENYTSVNYRYRESEQPPAYVATVLRAELDDVAVLKALDCYEYQSCEHPGWKASDAKTLIDGIRGMIFADRPELGKAVPERYDRTRTTEAYHYLPEYDAAPWTVTSLDQVAAVIVESTVKTAQREEAHRGEGTVYRERGRLDIVEIAKRMRVNLRNAQSIGMLPAEAKFSVTTERFAGGQSVDVEVRGMPDSWTYTTRESYTGSVERIYSDAARAMVDAIEGMLAEYNRDRSDTQTDYFDVWFYSHVRIEDERTATWRAEDAQRRKARAAARKARRSR